jgi:hypothetical protein
MVIELKTIMLNSIQEFIFKTLIWPKAISNFGKQGMIYLALK